MLLEKDLHLGLRSRSSSKEVNKISIAFFLCARERMIHSEDPKQSGVRRPSLVPYSEQAARDKQIGWVWDWGVRCAVTQGAALQSHTLCDICTTNFPGRRRYIMRTLGGVIQVWASLLWWHAIVVDNNTGILVQAKSYFLGPNDCDDSGVPAAGLINGSTSMYESGDATVWFQVPWEASRIAFTVNGQTINDNDYTVTLEIYGEYILQVTAAEAGTTFVDAMIRVQQGTNASNVRLEPISSSADGISNAAQLVPSCAATSGAVGIASVSSTFQTALAGRLVSFTTKDPLVIDVTVDLNGTSFAYTQYMLQTILPNATTTTPTTTTTLPPIPSPTISALPPTSTLLPTPSQSPAPTLSIECLVCGSDTLQVTKPDATIVLNNVVTTCGLVTTLGRFSLIPLTSCAATIAVVTANCDCRPMTMAPATTSGGGGGGEPVTVAPSVVPTTPLPTMPAMVPVPTPAPAPAITTASSECLVCGQPQWNIRSPNNFVPLNGVLVTCATVADLARLGWIPPSDCAATASNVQANCNCAPPVIIPATPAVAPTVPVSPPFTARPVLDTSSMASSSSSTAREQNGITKVGLAFAILAGLVVVGLAGFGAVRLAQDSKAASSTTATTAPSSGNNHGPSLQSPPSVQLTTFDFDQDDPTALSSRRPTGPTDVMAALNQRQDSLQLTNFDFDQETAVWDASTMPNEIEVPHRNSTATRQTRYHATDVSTVTNEWDAQSQWQSVAIGSSVVPPSVEESAYSSPALPAIAEDVTSLHSSNDSTTSSNVPPVLEESVDTSPALPTIAEDVSSQVSVDEHGAAAAPTLTSAEDVSSQVYVGEPAAAVIPSLTIAEDVSDEPAGAADPSQTMGTEGSPSIDAGSPMPSASDDAVEASIDVEMEPLSAPSESLAETDFTTEQSTSDATTSPSEALNELPSLASGASEPVASLPISTEDVPCSQSEPIDDSNAAAMLPTAPSTLPDSHGAPPVDQPEEEVSAVVALDAASADQNAANSDRPGSAASAKDNGDDGNCFEVDIAATTDPSEAIEVSRSTDQSPTAAAETELPLKPLRRAIDPWRAIDP
jgi:hypothetical protein